MRCAQPQRSNCTVRPASPERRIDGQTPSTLNARRSTRRRGFTLIEVLMVIVIIALLVGLLLPAINSAVVRAREARVSAEIQALASAIADFKGQFGFEPPSSLVLYEEAPGAGTSWNTQDAITRESRSVLRKMFSQLDFSDLDGDGTPGADVNGDGSPTPGPIVLNGAECLVFFLGGVPQRDASGIVSVAGFSKNPRAPFSRGGNRLGPFYPELNAGRLTDINQNLMTELLDPLPNQTNPYWYLSGNDGRGYKTPAVNGGTATDDVRVSGSTFVLFDVYRQTPPTAAPNAGPGTAYNPKSYQIISPGYDGQYGTGGHFDPDNADASLTTSPFAFPGTRDSVSEWDNITNFHQTRLAP